MNITMNRKLKKVANYLISENIKVFTGVKDCERFILLDFEYIGGLHVSDTNLIFQIHYNEEMDYFLLKMITCKNIEIMILKFHILEVEDGCIKFYVSENFYEDYLLGGDDLEIFHISMKENHNCIFPAQQFH